LFLNLAHSLSKTEAGVQFNMCLGTGTYNALVNFTNNIPDKQLFCCSDCSFVCANMAPTCPLGDSQVCYANGGGELPGQCSKVGQSRLCITSGYSVNSLPGKLCGGITSNTPTTNIAVGNCPDLNTVMNVLSIQSTAPTFS
jgi:hypothetical protein